MHNKKAQPINEAHFKQKLAYGDCSKDNIDQRTTLIPFIFTGIDQC